MRNVTEFATCGTKWLITKQLGQWHICAPTTDKLGRPIPGWKDLGGEFPTGAAAFAAFASGRNPQ